MIHLCGPISAVRGAELSGSSTRSTWTTPLPPCFRFSAGCSGYLRWLLIATATDLPRIQIFGDKGWAELRGETALEFQPVEGIRQVWTFPRRLD